jgi:hypothetical protein
VGGGVHGYQFIGKCVVECCPQHGADALPAGRAGRSYPGDGSTDGGVGAGAGGDDLLVAFDDRHQHGPDVAGSELVELEVAEVGNQVGVDRALVAALGAAGDGFGAVEVSDPFGQVLGDGRGGGDVDAAVDPASYVVRVG